MRAEIIAIGDELISGHIVNRNASWLSERLLELGVTPVYHSVVGDTVTIIEEAMNQALRRADLVICTGGLGPTEDDLTKRAIVKVFRRNLVFHDEALEELRRRYAVRGMEMPEINQNQALLPQGATLLRNRIGSAVGILFDEEGKLFVALPGVPLEMQAIFSEELAPLLKPRVGERVTLSRVVRTTGVSESLLAEMIGADIPLPEGVKLAYLPHTYGVDLRLMIAEDNARLAEELIEQPQGWLKRKLGPLVYGEQDATLEAVVGEALRNKPATVAVAESCTAGMICARLTDVPGASAYFERGYITYSNAAKERELDVNPETLAAFGAVSAETASEMARGALEHAGTDCALSVTGIAGPEGGTAEKPVGLVYISVADRFDGEPRSVTRKFQYGRDRTLNRERATAAAINLLRLRLLGERIPE